MLYLDDLKCTERAVAHLVPLRLRTFFAQVDERGLTYTFFLYQHFCGGWLIGHSADGAVVVAERVQGTGSLVVEVVGRFDEYVRAQLQELERSEPLLRERAEVERLTTAQELALSDAWVPSAARPSYWPAACSGVWSPDAPAAAKLCRQLQAACVGALRDAFSGRAAMAYLAPLAKWLEPLALQDARVWAFFLVYASEATQDGIEDALHVLERRGAEAFCKLLPEATMEFLRRVRYLQAKALLGDVALRFTVADLIERELLPFADSLLTAYRTDPPKAVSGSDKVFSVPPALSGMFV